MAKSYKDNFNDADGVWRTVGGRRIFIRNGQDLASAMIESGKFKNLRSAVKLDKLKKEEKEKLKNLKEKGILNEENKEDIENARKELVDVYKDRKQLEKEIINPMEEYSDTNGKGMTDAQQKILNAVKTSFLYKDEGEMSSGLQKNYELYGKENVDSALKYYEDNYELIKGVASDSEGLTYNDLIKKDEYPKNALKYYKNQMEELKNSGLQYENSKAYNDKADALKEELEKSKEIEQTRKDISKGKTEPVEKLKIENANRTPEQVNKEYEELSKKMQQDDYYYKPEDDRKLKELRSEYDTKVAKGEKDVNAPANTNNQELYNKYMKDANNYDKMKAKYDKQEEAYNKEHDKLSDEWRKHKYGTPEYENAYKKLTEHSNQHYNATKDMRDKLFKQKEIKALEEQGEKVVFNSKGDLLFHPTSYNEEKSRKVDLGIDVSSSTAIKDKEMLDSVVGQLSDGIWENSPGQNKYWSNMAYEQHNNRITFATRENGGYNPVAHHWVSNPFSSKSDQEVKDYLANKIKQIAKQEMKDNPSVGSWDRNNTNKLDYLGYDEEITVADAYNLYDRLKGRTPKTSSGINDDIRRKAYQKYLKEHPGSKMTFNDFMK